MKIDNIKYNIKRLSIVTIIFTIIGIFIYLIITYKNDLQRCETNSKTNIATTTTELNNAINAKNTCETNAATAAAAATTTLNNAINAKNTCETNAAAAAAMADAKCNLSKAGLEENYKRLIEESVATAIRNYQSIPESLLFTNLIDNQLSIGHTDYIKPQVNNGSSINAYNDIKVSCSGGIKQLKYISGGTNVSIGRQCVNRISNGGGLGVEYSKSTTSVTPNDGSTNNLISHNINCGPNEILTEIIPKFTNTMTKYDYKCTPNISRTPLVCTSKSTIYKPGQNGSALALNDHSISCDTGEVLNQVQFSKDDANNIKFNYTCCK